VRQAKRLADNLIATLRGRELTPYRHKHAGSVASLGLHKGVAEVYGVKLKGLPAWWMHRTYHMSRVPTFNRKVRVIADWTLALVLKREVVSLGAIERPRAPFEEAAGGSGRAPAMPAPIPTTGRSTMPSDAMPSDAMLSDAMPSDVMPSDAGTDTVTGGTARVV